MERKVYVIANWKMYKTAREATDYIEHLIPLIQEGSQNIYLSVPFTSIACSAAFAKQTKIVIGAQNMNDAREGAFTGEIAGLMLKEAGASFVLLGHSERRQVFGESNVLIHRKVLRALQDDIQPVLCVGETLQQRDSGAMEEVLREQISVALEGVPKEGASRIILAYEPVWAIGSGRAATPKMIEQAHSFCRQVLVDLFGKKRGDSLSIVYGGSVKADNVAEIMKEKNVDGVLVGGASLDVNTFAKIAHQCCIPKISKRKI